MDREFWLEKWASNKIGFHEPTTHRLLKQWWPTMELSFNHRILVPLCGKSLDMTWLNEHHSSVTGIEISEIGAISFFEENNFKFRKDEFRKYSVLYANGIEIYCGDIFEIPPTVFNPFDCVYDRAALVALSPSDRKHYESFISKVTKPKAKMLLVTVDYDEELITPPPHIISRDTIEKTYSDRWDLTELSTQTAEIKGIAGTETCYRLEKK